jgi:hypothetical protein
MSAKSTYVIPKNGGWAVKKEGSAKHSAGVYSTRKRAIEAALEIVQGTPAGQVVILGLDGSIQTRGVHGLPAVQTPPRRSKLGSKAIERAVSTVIRERLSRE